jgi:hypothetical protein
MTDLGYEDDDGYFQPASRRAQRGKKAVVALAGLAALAAGGMFLVTEAVPAKDHLVPELAVPAPRRTAATRKPQPESPYAAPTRPSPNRPKPKSSPSLPAISAVAPQRSPVPAMSPSMSLAQRVVIVRAAALPSPMPRPVRAAAAEAQNVTVTETGTIRRDGATLRVISAPADLTGQRELSWVVDAGRPVGDAWCSQNFYYGPGVPVGENPALLVCWKTSEMRSVVTVAVNAGSRPSAADSVAALDRQWLRLDPEPIPPL